MRLLLALLTLVLLTAATEAQLERGIKGNAEDVVLVGADDWHSSVAATPLAIWSENNRTVTNTLMILPREVNAGQRMGWIEQKDLDEYGVVPILHTLESANVTSIAIHGTGDLPKSMIEAAHKEGIKVYVTATLEPPANPESNVGDIQTITKQEDSKVASIARSFFLGEIGLSEQNLDKSKADSDKLQKQNPNVGDNGDYYCPINPSAREDLLNQVQTIIEDYKADGVVLYNFGFQDENYCFCDYCKDKFYKDTGIDLTKIYSNSYNLERWKQWKQDQIVELAQDAKNITTDLGPVKLGVAIGNPFDRSQGYNYAELASVADFTIVSPISASDAKLTAGMTDKPVFIRLSDSYVQYILSAQNVQGTVKYIEDLTTAGASGFAFEYNVVYTPLWSELQPPSNSARWLLKQLDGKTLGLGNVSWSCNTRIPIDNIYQMAEKVSERWISSPGAVIVGDNYTAGLTAATFASYLNWPVLFTGETMPNETKSAIKRLNASKIIIAGPLSSEARNSLLSLNLTLIEGDDQLLLKEMKSRGDSPNTVVLTNSHDLSLLVPVSTSDIKRSRIGDILVDTSINPTQIPAERPGEMVRLNLTLTNINADTAHDLQLVDIFPAGRLVRWPKPSQGMVNVTDPFSGEDSTPSNAFLDGSLLIWKVGDLNSEGEASLALEVEVLYPMDVGWTQKLDSGMAVTYNELSENVTAAKNDDWPIVNITYPILMPMGIANVSWNLARTSIYTAINIYNPEGRSGSIRITDMNKDNRYSVSIPLITPGDWKFNIEAGDGYSHKTGNYTIQVRANTPAVNITAFSHTQVPRLSLVAAQTAAARKAFLVDVAKDPQEVDPEKVESNLKDEVEKLNLSPEYLIVVGDPGSLPFLSTGLTQKISDLMNYDMYRDYQLRLADDNYTDVASGRIMGLSVYDASQLMARTLAYPKLNGTWKNNGMVIYSPPLEYPQAPIGISISEYLKEAGVNVKDLRWEEATYQGVISQMNNGQNIVHFDNHGNEQAWALSYWSMLDVVLDEAQVKRLTLMPQTTTASACVTSRLKGFYINVTGTKIYVPMRLDDSMALAFIRAGAVNYIAPSSTSWIFISDDYSKRFYQALTFENATVGQANVEADRLYRMKLNGADKVKDIKEYDQANPPWSSSMQVMLNQTANMNFMLGDPSFRPYIPKTPPLPYTTEVNQSSVTKDNQTEIKASITPKSETATDWIYWIEPDTTDGKLQLNAPPALIEEISVPKDAEKVVVREDGQAVWHYEEISGAYKRIMWPVVRPRLNEERNYTVEYVLIPGQLQVIRITPGWNAISIDLNPKDGSMSKYLKNKPYRGIFSVSGEDWKFNMQGVDKINLSTFQPGKGYLIDSSDNFTMNITGIPVEFPYRLTIEKGWNLIGVPFNKTLNINNTTVNAEHKRYKYQEAVDKGFISAFLWSYDGSNWNYLGENETMEPGKAYLIEAMNECRLEFQKGE